MNAIIRKNKASDNNSASGIIRSVMPEFGASGTLRKNGLFACDTLYLLDLK